MRKLREATQCVRTPCINAPPLALVRAPPFISASDLCLFTSCVLPNDSAAARFSPDIVERICAAPAELYVEVCCISGRMRSVLRQRLCPVCRSCVKIPPSSKVHMSAKLAPLACFALSHLQWTNISICSLKFAEEDFENRTTATMNLLFLQVQ